ncbi:TPA: hypothetical protein N0F65_006258 [Lagenidium giganteum]|uniref:Uncharacterized protein n=1 Tax=Lagenidium giganteum TaxID=4803 RepID=A0AAV2Z2V2_9STRA|nr:TPA: hypothetical protein N0F65_006258 [Lagenidium giganteum]
MTTSEDCTDEDGEDALLHVRADSLAPSTNEDVAAIGTVFRRSSMDQLQIEEDKDTDSIPPVYAARQPPLVQPLHPSVFAENIQLKYGVRDLGHEWVALFQMLGGTNTSHTRTMKLQIPDTVFLSPTGQPSMWYVTSASGRIKPRNLVVFVSVMLQRVTARAIEEAMVNQVTADDHEVVAVARHGFQIEYLTNDQLRVFCRDMSRPRIVMPLRSPSKVTDVPLKCFCLQRFLKRERNMTFVCVWRQPPATATTPSPRPGPGGFSLAHCDLFLCSPRAAANATCYCGDGADEEEELRNHVCFRYLPMKKDDDVEKLLRQYGFEPEKMVPQLFHMKVLMAEIVNRTNRGMNARQLNGLACEFFLGAIDGKVYFSALVGAHWDGHKPTWEALHEMDSWSKWILDHYDRLERRAEEDRKVLQQIAASPRRRQVVGENVALDLYHQLNPRFPSVELPHVAEEQWKCRSPLLAPDVAPRYVACEVPKSYRNGRFHPMLTPRQADATNRLHVASARPSVMVRQPLSNRHADVEGLGAGDSNRTRPLPTPSSVHKPTKSRRSPQPLSPRARLFPRQHTRIDL